MEKETEQLLTTKDVPLLRSYRFLVILCIVSTITFCHTVETSMGAAMVCISQTDDSTHTNKSLPYMAHNLQVNNYNNGSHLQRSNFTPSSEMNSHPSIWRLDWDKRTQGWVLSSFFIGYYVMQLPSCVLASRFGPKVLLVSGMIVTTLGSFLTVFSAIFSTPLVFVVRTVTGMFGPILYNNTFQLIGSWVPKHERNIAFGLVGFTRPFGILIAFIYSSFACGVDFEDGWPIIFYIVGGTGLVIGVVDVFLLSDSPFNNKFISEIELQNISNLIPKYNENLELELKKIPFKSIFTCLPVWAIVAAMIASDCMFFAMLTVTPQYLKEVIRLSNLQTNLLSGIPYVAMGVCTLMLGFICTRVIENNLLSTTVMRKINEAFAKLGTATSIVCLSYLPEGDIVGVAFFNTLLYVAISSDALGWEANIVDLAPEYAGMILAITSTGSMWVACVVPVMVESITVDHTRAQWQEVFFIVAALQVWACAVYLIFASADQQSWAAHRTESEMTCS